MMELVNARLDCQRILDYERTYYPVKRKRYWDNIGDWRKMTYETIPKLSESFRVRGAFYVFDQYNDCRAMSVV